MEDRIKKVMAAVFAVPVAEISDNASLHEIEAWDSLRHINLILALEEEFGIHFEEEEIATLVNFKMIVAAVMVHVDE